MKILFFVKILKNFKKNTNFVLLKLFRDSSLRSE